MESSARKRCFEVAKGLRKGDILLWRNYVFPDGSKKSKYAIILSNCIEDKIYIFALPTSQIGFYKNPKNNIDTVWIKENRVKEFPALTVVDLKHHTYGRASLFGEKIYNNTLEKIGCLPEDLIKEIDEAVKKAKTLSPEIKNLIIFGKRLES